MTVAQLDVGIAHAVRNPSERVIECGARFNLVLRAILWGRMIHVGVGAG